MYIYACKRLNESELFSPKDPFFRNPSLRSGPNVLSGQSIPAQIGGKDIEGYFVCLILVTIYHYDISPVYSQVFDLEYCSRHVLQYGVIST